MPQSDGKKFIDLETVDVLEYYLVSCVRYCSIELKRDTRCVHCACTVKYYDISIKSSMTTTLHAAAVYICGTDVYRCYLRTSTAI